MMPPGSFFPFLNSLFGEKYIPPSTIDFCRIYRGYPPTPWRGERKPENSIYICLREQFSKKITPHIDSPFPLLIPFSLSFPLSIDPFITLLLATTEDGWIAIRLFLFAVSGKFPIFCDGR